METINSIAELRKKLGLSQEKFAFEIGIYQTHISDIERNIKKPSIMVVHNICKLAKKHGYEIDLDKLLMNK